MRHAVFVAPFGPLADPGRLLELTHAVEEHGWDGLFLWDHVMRRDPEVGVLDPWVMFGAMATATERIRLGPMVTPLVRRRLIKLAREAVTVDALSAGRLTLGLGLGVDTSGELSRFGEVLPAVERGAMLDEGVPVLGSMLEGAEVEHVGEYFTVDGVRISPPTVQRPRPPFWFAARGDARKPVRRAARYEGVFPIEMNAEQYEQLVETIEAERGSLDGFDIAVSVDPGDTAPDYTDGTATWTIHAFGELPDIDSLFESVVAGPPG